MISIVKGKVVHIKENTITLMAGYVGYDIKVSTMALQSIDTDSELTVYTHLQVKEDAHSLFGFLNEQEKECFRILISVKGVGPSVGLSILSTLTVKDILNSIVNEDLQRIKSIKGVGNKMAQRIILELKDKVSTMNFDIEEMSSYDKDLRHKASQALVSLGMNRSLANKSIDEILNNNPKIELEDLIKIALNSENASI